MAQQQALFFRFLARSSNRAGLPLVANCPRGRRDRLVRKPAVSPYPAVGRKPLTEPLTGSIWRVKKLMGGVVPLG